MKKLLIFCLVISMAPCALAVPVLRVDPADLRDYYYPSSVITIQLYDSGQVIGFSIDAITDNGVGGTALEPQVINAKLSRYGHFGTLNSNGMLVEYVYGFTDIVQQPATGVLYSFDYHIPDVPFSTIINIHTTNDGGDNWYPAEIDYIDGSYYRAPPELGLVIHLPEPATMILLALGGLALLRKRRA